MKNEPKWHSFLLLWLVLLLASSVVGCQAPLTIAFSPPSFSFNAQQGETNLLTDTLHISNSGGGTLDWSVSSDVHWLTLSPTSGSLAGEIDEVTVSVELDINRMNVGNYTATITVSAPRVSNVPQTVPVRLTITEPEQPKPSSSPSHILRLTDLAKDSQYWNTGWDAVELYQTLRSVNKSYHEKHTYIEGMFACANMAVDIWNILHKQGITSVIVVGNLDLDKERFAECNHVWLLIMHKDSGFRILVIEPTNGETYFFDPETKAFVEYIQGYYFSSPSDFRAYTKGRW